MADPPARKLAAVRSPAGGKRPAGGDDRGAVVTARGTGRHGHGPGPTLRLPAGPPRRRAARVLRAAPYRSRPCRFRRAAHGRGTTGKAEQDVTLGALGGSLLGGYLADRYGRQRAVLIAGLLFIAGALLQAFAPGIFLLVAGRLVVGFGVGVAAVAAPLYGSELAPAAHRGRFVSAYQLAITIGIFLAYLVNSGIAASDSWRWMLGISVVPGDASTCCSSLGNAGLGS